MTSALHTRLRSASGSRLIALIAAHNQESRIGTALTSLAAQTRPPDEVIVVADRCTDRTAEIAVAHGARVFHTVADELGTAGTLKPSLQTSLIDLQPSEGVYQVDAFSDASDCAPPQDHEAARPSSRLQHRMPRFGPTTARLSQRLGRAPNASELAAELGMDREEVIWGVLNQDAVGSTSADDSATGRPIAVRAAGLDYQGFTGGSFGGHDRWRARVASLPESERAVVVLRFFGGLSQTEIAAQMGMSTMEVLRLLTRALATLRDQPE